MPSLRNLIKAGAGDFWGHGFLPLKSSWGVLGVSTFSENPILPEITSHKSGNIYIFIPYDLGQSRLIHVIGLTTHLEYFFSLYIYILPIVLEFL